MDFKFRPVAVTSQASIFYSKRSKFKMENRPFGKVTVYSQYRNVISNDTDNQEAVQVRYAVVFIKTTGQKRRRKAKAKTSVLFQS